MTFPWNLWSTGFWLFYELKILRIHGLYLMETSMFISCSLLDIRFEKKSWLHQCTVRRRAGALKEKTCRIFIITTTTTPRKYNFAIPGPVEWNINHVETNGFLGPSLFAVRKNVSGWRGGGFDWRDTKDVIFPIPDRPRLCFFFYVCTGTHITRARYRRLASFPLTAVIVVSKDVDDIFYRGAQRGWGPSVFLYSRFSLELSDYNAFMHVFLWNPRPHALRATKAWFRVHGIPTRNLYFERFSMFLTVIFNLLVLASSLKKKKLTNVL